MSCLKGAQAGRYLDGGEFAWGWEVILRVNSSLKGGKVMCLEEEEEEGENCCCR